MLQLAESLAQILPDRTNPNKVLLIVNSNPTFSALSTQVADYYQSARKLGNDRLSWNFSSDTVLTNATENAAFINAVHAYVTANDIEMIVCSACVPHSINAWMVADSVTPKSMGSVLATTKAYGWSGGNASTPDFVYSARHPADSLAGLNYFQIDSSYNVSMAPYADPYVRKFGWEIKNLGWSSFNTLIPVGRIGIPRFHSYYPAESFATCKAIIDAAIAKEAVLQADKLALPIHFWQGIDEIASVPWITQLPCSWPDPETARRIFQIEGFTNFKILDTGSRPHSPEYNAYTFLHDYYYNVTPGSQSFKANNLVAPNKDLWAYIGFGTNLYGASGADSTIFDGAANTYNFLPGAWGVGGASYGLSELGARFLLDGAVAFSGSVNEPYADALPDVFNFTRLILLGASLSEALMYSGYKGYWQLDTWGDPMYRPYKFVELPPGVQLNFTAADLLQHRFLVTLNNQLTISLT